MRKWLVVFVTGVIVFGALGWLESLYGIAPLRILAAQPTWNEIWESVYRAAQLFASNFNTPHANWYPSPLLNVVRFAALLFTCFAIVYGLFADVRVRIRAARNSFAADSQVVILGYGRIGQSLAGALRTLHPPRTFFGRLVAGFTQRRPRQMRIVALDLKAGTLGQRDAARSGIELLAADATDLQSIRNAPCKLAKADQVFIALGNDHLAIATAAEIATRVTKKGARIWIHLNDRSLLDQVRHGTSAHDGGGPITSTFSLTKAAGEQIVANTRPVLRARASGQNRLHAIFVRFDDDVWPMIEMLVMMGSMPPPTFARPRISIIDSDAARAEARWRARHPHLHRWADIRFFAHDPATLCWSGRDATLAEIETLDPPTAYVFARAGDSDVLSEALALRQGMIKGLRQGAPVSVVSECAGIAKLGLQTVDADLADRIAVVGDLREAALFSHAVNRWLDGIARAFHAKYSEKYPGPAFDALPETMQESNRRAALHTVQLLAYFGFEGIDIRNPSFGLSKRAARQLTELIASHKEMLGAYEHLRWCIDRTLDGWTAGPRNAEARQRDQLKVGPVAYFNLPKHERDKDAEQLEVFAATLLARAKSNSAKIERIVDEDGPDAVWTVSDGGLVLGLRAPPDWQRYLESGDGVNVRVRIFVPAEPALASLNPDQRAEARHSAYAAFAETLLAAVPGDMRFRLVRARQEGWNWLGSLSDDANARIDGVTLPPLTVGFCGHRNLAAFGDGAERRAEEGLKAVLSQLSARGRPMRLVTGIATGADAIMIEQWAAADLGPVVGFVTAGETAGLEKLKDKLAVSETVGGTGDDAERYTDLATRILVSADVLVAYYDGGENAGDGSTAHTVARARKMDKEVIIVPAS